MKAKYEAMYILTETKLYMLKLEKNVPGQLRFCVVKF